MGKMELGLRGKGALVTGASRGIAWEIARALAAEGVSVAICSRHQEEIEAAAREIEEATGSTAVPIVADMARPDDIRRFVEGAAQQLGRIDILVNSAFVPRFGSLLDLPDEAIVEAFEAKLLGYARAALAALLHMRRQGGGRIINIAGGSGRQPGPNIMPGMVNAAIVNLTKAMAEDLAPEKITVNAISPGLVNTQRWQGIQARMAQEQGVTPEEVYQRLASGIPMGRLGREGDIAAVAVYLASERASYITGAHITVDGGSTRMAF
ncbi:MAG: SDR family oxidoreductase [Dehalococcoidia bacterium]